MDHSSHQGEVIRKLASIPSSDPEDVLTAAKMIFEQRQWTVQGNVYQAAGHVYLTTVTQQAGNREKSLLEKWQTWAALVASILTAITLTFQLRDKLSLTEPGIPEAATTGSTERNPLPKQPLAGLVRSETGEPLQGVRVSLPQFGIVTVTDQDGHFHLEVSAPKEDSVDLLSQKDGYQPDERYVTLGDTMLSYTMRQKRP